MSGPANHRGVDDLAVVDEFMTRLARARVEPGALASSDVIWLKAQLLRRWEAERTVTLPLDVLEPVQILAALATAVLALLWTLPTLVRALTLG